MMNINIGPDLTFKAREKMIFFVFYRQQLLTREKKQKKTAMAIGRRFLEPPRSSGDSSSSLDGALGLQLVFDLQQGRRTDNTSELSWWVLLRNSSSLLPPRAYTVHRRGRHACTEVICFPCFFTWKKKRERVAVAVGRRSSRPNQMEVRRSSSSFDGALRLPLFFNL